MNRRKAIKGLTALGALNILPLHLLFSEEENKPFHFVGIGNGGSNALKYIYEILKGTNSKFTYITDFKKKSEINFIQYIPQGTKYYSRKTNFGNIPIKSYDSKIPLVIPTEVKKIFKKNYRYVLLAGFGGYTGTLMTEKLTTLLFENKKEFITIGSIPYIFEGKHCINRAKKSIKQLEAIPNFKYFDLEVLREKYGDMGISEAFHKADEEFYRIFCSTA